MKFCPHKFSIYDYQEMLHFSQKLFFRIRFFKVAHTILSDSDLDKMLAVLVLYSSSSKTLMTLRLYLNSTALKY